MKKYIILVLMLLCVPLVYAQYDYAISFRPNVIKVLKETGVKTKTFKGNDPSLSPDGNRLVYTKSYKKGNRKLAMVDLVSGKETIITSMLSYGGKWSPNGEKILFNEFDSSDWHISIVDPNTKNVERIGEGYGGTWCGDTIVVFHDLNKITFEDLRDPEKRRIIDIKELIGDAVLISSNTKFYAIPERKQLVFNGDSPSLVGSSGMPLSSVYACGNSGRIERLTSENIDIADLIRIAKSRFVYIRITPKGWENFVIPLKGGKSKKIGEWL